MPEHKAIIRFANDVWKTICWFTYNFPTEIGALGKMKLVKDKETGEKYFYVYKLLFPQQKVTGASVHFTPEDWGPLVKEHGLKGLSDANFYWHRHPGGSAHSSTDDVDTFETFMSVEAGRKYFAFLQTAVNSTGWNSEARIDIRVPIRHTITHTDIKLEVDKSPAEEEVRKECEAIAEKCIIKDEVKIWKQYGKNDSVNSYKSYRKDKQNTLDTESDDGQFGKIIGSDDFDNDFLGDIATALDEKVSISFKDGQATIISGSKYGKSLEEALTTKKSVLNKLVGSWKDEKGESFTKYNLQPKTKMYKDMKESLIKSYFVFCKSVKDEWEKDIIEISEDELRNQITESNIEDVSEKKAIEMLIPTTKKGTLLIEGFRDVRDTLIFLEEDCIIDWANNLNGTAYDLDYVEILGKVVLNEDETTLRIYGKKLILFVEEIQQTIEYTGMVEEEEQ